MEIFKDRLKNERMRMSLSQHDLAELMNISKQAVSHWETGLRFPDALTVKALADLFHVTTDYLLGRTNNPGENKGPYFTEEPIPELRRLVDNAKELPKEVINSLNQIINCLKDSYKMLRIEINNEIIGTVVDTDLNTAENEYDLASIVIDNTNKSKMINIK